MVGDSIFRAGRSAIFRARRKACTFAFAFTFASSCARTYGVVIVESQPTRFSPISGKGRGRVGEGSGEVDSMYERAGASQKHPFHSAACLYLFSHSPSLVYHRTPTVTATSIRCCQLYVHRQGTPNTILRKHDTPASSYTPGQKDSAPVSPLICP